MSGLTVAVEFGGRSLRFRGYGLEFKGKSGPVYAGLNRRIWTVRTGSLGLVQATLDSTPFFPLNGMYSYANVWTNIRHQFLACILDVTAYC